MQLRSIFKQKINHLALFVALLENMSMARAAEPMAPEAEYFPNDIPIVLSATRLKQTPDNAPAAITIIDRQMIDASGFTEIPDMLRLVPGFIVDYDSGNIQVAGYHFLPDVYVRQQQVLIDGRSVYSPTLGGVNWANLPITIDDIERIEVIRGPNAVTYGSNSFLGVINIITKSPAAEHDSSVKTNIGSHELHEGFLRLNDSAKNLDYRLSLAYRSDNGVDSRFDSKMIRLINTNIDYQLNKNNSINFQAGYNENRLGKDDLFNASTPNLYKNNFNQYQLIRWESKDNVDEGIHFQFYHNREQENNAYTIHSALGDYYADTGKLGERYDAEIQFTGKADNNYRYVIGASYRLDQVSSFEFFHTYDFLKSHYRRFFVQIEQPIDNNIILNYGSMIENNDLTGTSHSPRIAINYHVTSKDTLRASISKATRTPIIFEAHPDNKILVPGVYYNQYFFESVPVMNEHITAYDLGLISNKLDNSMRYDARIFYEKISGLIGELGVEPYADADGKAKSFANLDDILLRGVEFQCDWNVTARTKLHGGISRIKINSENIGDTSQYSDAAPVNSYNILLMHKISTNTNFSSGIYYRSNMKPIVRRNSDPLTMPATTRVDMRLENSRILDSNKHTIALVIQNVFNDKYYVFQNNIIDRRGYVSYKIEF